MAPGQPYFGPISMVESRYASPHRRKQVEALLASNPELHARINAENILAIREQAAPASNGVHTQNAGVQLAQAQSQAQSQALEQEIAQHKHVLDQTVSTVVAKTRQILILISDSIKQERPDTAVASLKAVENLRLEMQKLIGATRQAQGALPYFLEKQKENSNLMAGAKIQEAHHDIQRELDHKDKKIKLGEELVFGQQQAFKDVEAEADYKTAELQERLTRLHMELGLVRTELNTMNGQLEKAHEAEKDAVKVRDELKQKLATLADSNKSLAAEKQDLRGAIKDNDAKLKAAKEETAEHYEKKLRSLKDQLQEEQQKAARLDTHLKTLRQAEETSRREVDKVKAELKLASEKYNNQSGAYAKKSEELKGLAKTTEMLDGEVRGLQQQKLELEKERDRVTFFKDSIQKQHGALKSELDDMKQKSALAKEEAQQLSAKLKRAENENDELETENNDLRAKQVEHNKVVAASKKADAEIATLRATVQNLQSKPITINDRADVAVVKQELQALNEKFTQSESNRAEWEKLGRKAMDQYRDMLPKYRQLEGVDKQLKQIQAEYDQLKTKAASGTNSDAKYWCDKYHELLADTEN